MDIDKFLQEILRRSTQHQRLYHFTDKKNIESIKQHGLLSTSELRTRGLINNVKTGGDANSLASDMAKGTDRYACLCFTNSHPMAYIAETERGLDPVYLQIDPQILKVPGAMITNAASNQWGVERVAAATALDSLDLEVLYKRMDWSDPKVNARLKVAEKYEILIPSGVATSSILYGLG